MEESLRLLSDFLKEQEDNKHRNEQDNKCYLALVNHVFEKLNQ